MGFNQERFGGVSVCNLMYYGLQISNNKRNMKIWAEQGSAKWWSRDGGNWLLWQRYPKPSHRPFMFTTKRPDVNCSQENSWWSNSWQAKMDVVLWRGMENRYCPRSQNLISIDLHMPRALGLGLWKLCSKAFIQWSELNSYPRRNSSDNLHAT